MTDPLRFVIPPETVSSSTATDEPATPAAATPEPGQPVPNQPVPTQPNGSGNASAAPPAPASATPSAAELRFQSCRWRKAETPPFCSHPEVLPFAGTTGFKPESWCPGCAFYKLRRNPRRDY
jgi:hypothetical protein